VRPQPRQVTNRGGTLANILSNVSRNIAETRRCVTLNSWITFAEYLIVITRHMAELVGGDEKLFEAWNRMELGGVSIALECPRYVYFIS
jgi:hypothetical protein